MTDVPELFAGAAAYYARYRADYPDEVFTELAERLGLDGRQRALDLGSGPGMAAFPLSRHVAEIVAVDPDPDMLAEGVRLAASRGITNLSWVRGDSATLPRLDLGAFDLVVMAASFHWMDRAATLSTLDAMVRAAGAVVVVTGGMSGTGPDVEHRPQWADAVIAVRQRWIPFRRRWRGDSSSDVRTYSDVRRAHRDALHASAFSHVESYDVRWVRRHDVDSLVGLQMTIPDSTPAALGGNAAAFQSDLRETLAAIEPDGGFAEPIRSEVLIARRPQ
ncbi:MAG: class I SAM-dependent methyltransferase [Micromonosporaceae bacterium]